MTSLSQQLKKLSTPQTNLLDHKKKKASILFPASEVASYTKDTIYQIGISGFNELLETNGEFCKYKELLFGEKTKEFQRVIENKETNEKLDNTIEEFLLMLSPYIQKQASLKALEWLLHRFLINEMNIDSVMMCIFPYYETVIFVRILHVLRIYSDNTAWNWLKQYQANGRPIPKETVFLHWASDQWFRNFLIRYFRKMIAVPGNGQNVQLAASFLISTQIGGLTSAEKITENMMSSVCQTLQPCLAADRKDVLSGLFLMIGQLCISVPLSPNFLDEIIQKLAKNSNPELSKETALCLLTIFYYQNCKVLSPKMLKLLRKNDVLLAQISSLARTKPVAPLMSPFVNGFVELILSSEMLGEMNKKKEFFHLLDIVEAMPLTPSESYKIIRSFLRAVSKCRSHLKSFEDPINMNDAMKQLEMSHPEGFDKAYAKTLKAINSRGSEDPLTAFEHEIFTEYKKEWDFAKKSAEVPIEKPKSDEELWLECLLSEKLSTPCSDFLRRIYSKIILDESRMANPFWEISDEKDEFSRSLKSLVRLLKIIVSRQIADLDSTKCEKYLKKIFNEKLLSIKNQIYFLCMIFGWNTEAEDIGINRCLKLWALRMTHTLLSSDESGAIAWVLDSTEPVVASLVTPICEGDVLCKAAFEVLEKMRQIAGGRLQANSLSVFVEAIINRKEEISKDVSYLPSTISSAVTESKGVGLKAVESILSCLTDNQIPFHIKSSILFTISGINNEDLFSKLIPIGNNFLDDVANVPAGKTLHCSESSCLYYILLRFSTNDALLLNIKGGWKLFKRSLEISDPVLLVSGQHLSPQEIVVNYKLLQGLSNSSRQLEVLEILISRIVKTNNSNEAAKLSRELKKLCLEASQIISLLNKLELLHDAKSVKEARRKKLKIQKEGDSKIDNEKWRKLELLIELVGVMTELQQPWMLVGPICDHMQVLTKFETSFSDTLQQQMLSVCHHLLNMSSQQLNKEDFAKKCKLNVALIVQCIRTSVNPDIHRRAILILSLASNYYPDQVLHNIMAIFTFMGTSLLRRDDSYSFHVINLAVTSIVPTLIQGESSDPEVLLKKLSQVTQVFVDALPALAEHRRLPLFTQLATTLGVSQYLWLVMVLIADAYVTQEHAPEEGPSHEGESRRLPDNIHFALVLYSQFSVIDQLKSCCEVVSFVCDLPEDKRNKGVNKTISVINFETRTALQLRQLKYTCVGLLVHLLSSEKFVSQIFELTNNNVESELEELKTLYKVLLEKSLQYLKLVGKQEQKQKAAQSGRFWQAMQRKLMDLVDAVNSLLPPMLLVDVISNLIGSDSPAIRCRAMEILASKLQPDVVFFKDEEIGDLLFFIEPLRKAGMDVKENENNRQTALFTLQLLTRRINSKVDPANLLSVLGSTVNLIKNRDPSTKVVTQAALVIAETVQVLKLNSVVHLDELIPAFLAILSNSLQEEEANVDNLIIASAIALHRIVENVPRLLPTKDLESLFAVSCRLLASQGEDGRKDFRLTSKLTNTLEQLVHNVELRILMPVLIKTLDKIIKESLAALPSFVSVLETLVVSVKAPELTAFKTQLIYLFTSALNVRTSARDVELKKIEYVEGCIISALTRFLLKLNEEENCSIFSSLWNWASKQQDSEAERLITFFRFADNLVGSLKVLFIKAKLARKVIDNASDYLDRNNNLLHENTIFGKGPIAERKASELIKYILDTLTKIFIYDSIRFTDEERFNTLVDPLISQIENTVGSQNEYEERLDNLTICIVKFTKACGDDLLWKQMNLKILQRLQTDKEPKVILAGLKVFEGLVESLGEDYLRPLLPDTIPYITEVLESLDDDVQRKTKEIFNKMEEILGDSLRAHLDT